jgi:prepilin-type processing-associated H-X9-DG protein/prepilin-type N-terminal cleavage/methylation domain-containing protein
MSGSSHRRPAAFSLVELLVVIAIIAVLSSLAFLGFNKARESSRTTKCIANLREISIAMQFYTQENNDQYPRSTANEQIAEAYWFYAISPYLAEGRRFDQSKVNVAMPVLQNIPFACPSCTNHGWGGAGIDVGINGYQVGATTDQTNITNALRIAKVSEPSTTMLVADANGWLVGNRIGPNGSFSVADAAVIDTRHGGRANVLYFDGHVGQVTAAQLKDRDFVEKLGGPKF